MNKNNAFVFLKKSQRLQSSNFDLLNQTNEFIKIQEKTFFKNFGKKNIKKFSQILKNFNASRFQKFGQKKNFFSFFIGQHYVSKQSFILCMCKKFIKKQSFFLNQSFQNLFFEILNTLNLLKNFQNLILKTQFFSKVFEKKKSTIFQIINIQKLQKKFFEKKILKTLFFREFLKSSQKSFKLFQEHIFSNTILFTPKFKFFLFSFFLELQFSIVSNLKNVKKIQRKIFFQTFSKNFIQSVFRIQFFETFFLFHFYAFFLQKKAAKQKSDKKEKQNKNLFFYNKTFMMINLQKKDKKSNEIKFLQKEKHFFVQNFSKKIFVFVFSWIFALVTKNIELHNVDKKNLFFIKQKISFGSLKKAFSQNFDLRLKYSQIYALNSLNLFKNIIEFFYSFLNFLSLNLFEHWNHFQIIYHQYLKFHFLNFQTELQKNQFWFLNFLSFQIYEKTFLNFFFCFYAFFQRKKAAKQKSEKKFCLLFHLDFFHLIPQNFEKPFGFFTEQNLQTFLQKNFQKPFSFFLNSIKKEKKRVENFTSQKMIHFEKTYFHFYNSIDAKKLKKNFFSSFVFFLKKNFLTVSKFSFLNSDFQNFRKKPIFLLWQKYFSNFLFFNSTLLLFFKNSYFLKKILFPIRNFLFLKNSSYSIFLQQMIEQKEIFVKKSNNFFTKPFFPKIIQMQKEKNNIFYDQNIFWLLSKKFLFFPTKIQKFDLFHFSPFFSDFLILYKKSMALFCSQVSQTKKFLSFIYFLNQQPMQLVLNSQKKQKRKYVFLKKKELFFIHQKKNQMQKKNKKIFFQNSFFQNLNFNCFSVCLRLNSNKQIKYFYNFEKKPTYKNIQNHLNECKQILKKSIGQKQLNFMKKLHKKIQSWSKNYNTSSNQKIFEYCDSILLKFLWNWARKTHPNKSKGWIRKKYFHFIYSHKWFFGKKIGTIFICLPLHSQTNFK
uniref:Group II intron maturase-specific domain-containing protein n=1 Tax=Tetradesmus obliquus TaxID=3088 RepID=A0A249RWW8_TETOB|nr:hypothetical protein [Tetradesmus obliquus]